MLVIDKNGEHEVSDDMIDAAGIIYRAFLALLATNPFESDKEQEILIHAIQYLGGKPLR